MTDLSYMSRPSIEPYQYKSIIDVLNERADGCPDKEIFIERLPNGTRRTITYIELKHKAERTAKYLVSKGVRPCDSVGIFGPNSMEWIIGELAILMTGAVSMHVVKPPGPFRKTMERLEQLECKALLLDPDDDEEYIESLLEFLRNTQTDGKECLETPSIILLKKLENCVLPNVESMADEATTSTYQLPTRIFPDTTAIVYLTSGTTGNPKMVQHSHFGIVNSESATAFVLGADEQGGCSYNDRPFCWSGGTPVYSLIFGVVRVFRDGRITVKSGGVIDLWNIMKEERCTNALLLPFTIYDLLQNKEEILTTNYRPSVIVTGGQLIGKQTTEVLGKFCERYVMLYGSTEIAIITLCDLGPDMVVGRLGTLYKGAEVKIVGDDGNPVIRGQIGEIYAKCPWMFSGYRNATEAQKKALINGWFSTGDTGLITTDDDLIMKGRAKNVIKRGTLKVLAEDVEKCISNFPGVTEVVVVAVPDVRLHEDVCACVVLDKDVKVAMAEIEFMCKDTLGDNVIGDSPTYYLECDSLPRLDTGKPDKVKIRRNAIDRLNIKDI